VVLCILVLEFLEKRWKEKRPIRMVASISQFNLDFHIIAFEKLISVLWYVWWNLSLLLVPVSELLPVYWITPCLSCPLPLLYICFISYCSVQYNKQNVCTLYIHLLLLLSSSPPPTTRTRPILTPLNLLLPPLPQSPNCMTSSRLVISHSFSWGAGRHS